ncbi:HTH domain-containing protein [Dyadobacter psychrotolerans]|uniref:HTH domain-containing protein n=1 Tax=Dyadobacter psychrotolerans TaxID=2541721 RepID=A0A4R5DF20_9BACT|nr:HTH domain-containing protein [Dyadobacter psychrotolerans]TDE12522.1 HTH domain-containing protein [Dyadobacter psychrotolerans]
MNLTKYFERFRRLHRLISKKATGSPIELASKLDLSERAVFEYIRIMREIGAPISFCPIRRSYYYEREVRFDIGFRELDDKEVTDVDGGCNNTSSTFLTECVGYSHIQFKYEEHP